MVNAPILHIKVCLQISGSTAASVKKYYKPFLLHQRSWMLSDKWPPVMSQSSDILSLHREKSLCWRVSGSNGAFYLPGVAAAALHLFLRWRPWQYKPHFRVQQFRQCTSLRPDDRHTAVKRGTPLRHLRYQNQKYLIWSLRGNCLCYTCSHSKTRNMHKHLKKYIY